VLVLITCNELHDLVVDDAGIRVIDSSVSADQKLRVLFLGEVG